MNKLSFAGRLGSDAEVKFLPNGDPLCSFTVASDVGYGEKKSTNWLRCKIWGKRGEALAPHLTKGQQVTVWGTLQLREWTTKDGVKQLSPDVRVDEIELQGGKREGGSQPASKPIKSRDGERTPQPFEDDSDIPF